MYTRALVNFRYCIYKCFNRCCYNVGICRETVVRFFPHVHLYMYFSKVITSFGDCLDKEFLKMNSFADKLSDSSEGSINGTITRRSG